MTPKLETSSVEKNAFFSLVLGIDNMCIYDNGGTPNRIAFYAGLTANKHIAEFHEYYAFKHGGVLTSFP